MPFTRKRGQKSFHPCIGIPEEGKSHGNDREFRRYLYPEQSKLDKRVGLAWSNARAKSHFRPKSVQPCQGAGVFRVKQTLRKFYTPIYFLPIT